MITLYQPPPVWGLPSMSPFCVKLETYLRMAKVEYQAKGGSPIRGPKGKVPYIKDGDKVIGDSELIIDYLCQKYGDRLDYELDPLQKAVSLAMRRMVEEHLYFAVAWLRWATDDSFKYVEEFFLKVLPPVVGRFIMKKVRKRFLRNIYGQGMARHTREEIIHFAKQDLAAVSIFLGNKKFAMGDKPTSLDATFYGFLIQGLWIPWESPIKEYLRSLPNLEAYCLRMKEAYWS